MFEKITNSTAISVKVYWPKYTENAGSIENDLALKHSLTKVPEGKTAQEMIALQKRYLLTFTILMYTIEPNMTYYFSKA